jgi:hypothetical protein
MAVVKWKFEDPVTLESHTFAINPSEGGSPDFKKSFSTRSTTAGKALIFEGADEPQRLSFSGVLFTEEEYEAFREWWQKRRQIKITDDLGRSYFILIQAFVPNRRRARSHPWKHDYQVDATIVDWA